MLFSVDDARASVSFDGVVVNGGARRQDGDETRLDFQAINRCRGFMIDYQLALFEGTIEDSIVLGRSYIPYSDIRWALRFTELEENVDALPRGLKVHIRAPGKMLALSISCGSCSHARSWPVPEILIFDGIIHNM